MFYFFHQVVINLWKCTVDFYSFYAESSSLKRLKMALIRAVRVNQNSQIKTSWSMLRKLHRTEGNCRVRRSSVGSLLQTPLTLQVVLTVDIRYIEMYACSCGCSASDWSQNSSGTPVPFCYCLPGPTLLFLSLNINKLELHVFHSSSKIFNLCKIG